MQRLKRGGSIAASGFRSILLRNQGTTVYDIELVIWTSILTDGLKTNDSFVAALSLLESDQREDLEFIPFDNINEDDGYSHLFSFATDFETEGGMALIPQLVIPHAKPFTVPYLSMVATGLLAATARINVEIFFERRSVSAFEKANEVVGIRSRARTS